MYSLKACDCNPEGSDVMKCSSHGICTCKPRVVGKKCDRCEDKFKNHPDCDECATNYYGDFPDCKCKLFIKQ